MTTLTGRPDAGATGRVPVSVVISAHNEAKHIGDCVRSVAWASEIVVIENASTDGTPGIARDAGATVISNPAFVSLERQRNDAIGRASHDWVLVLDADERATPELAREIERVIRSPDAGDALRIRRVNHFLGRHIRYGGWERDRPVRLFRRHLRYRETMHGRVDVDRAATLREPMIHYPYADLDAYFEKLVRYSRMWAEDHYKRGRRASAFTVVVRPPLRFLTMFVLRRGFLDGSRGAIVAALAAASVLAKYARLWDLSRDDKSIT